MQPERVPDLVRDGLSVAGAVRDGVGIRVLVEDEQHHPFRREDRPAPTLQLGIRDGVYSARSRRRCVLVERDHRVALVKIQAR